MQSSRSTHGIAMMHRIWLSGALLALSMTACAAAAQPARHYDVGDVPLWKISADLAAGKATSVAITRAYIARIERFDASLNAVIRIAPDALEQAAASDRRRAAGKALGALDGVPVLFKDNIDAVGMPTTAGSYALLDNVPATDSEVVRRLRAAGVVILGKTNTSQFAGFRTRLSFNGSTVGGGPRNPYDRTRSACGSSNGSAVATAVSFAAAAIGTETSGSIVCPASFTGLVGIKPTIALVSRRGIVPISLTQDTAGPMTRTVKDAALLLDVMAGTDAADPWTQGADAHRTDYVKALRADALAGTRLGVVRSLAGYDERTRPLFDAALRVLSERGA
jgi:amidase